MASLKLTVLFSLFILYEVTGNDINACLAEAGSNCRR